VVVLVGGLGSTSSDAAVDEVDTAALGYRPEDVYRFSYEGGRTPDPTDRRQHIDATVYTAADSQVDLVESGTELAALVDELARLEPGVAIDVVAHSQGGLVARLALLELDATGDTGSLGTVVTLGTPHRGADLATAAAAVRSDRAASRVFRGLDDLAGPGLVLDAPAVRQLAVGSELTDLLSRSGVAPGVHLTSVSARGDLVVASTRSHVDGAANITVPLAGIRAHDQLPADPATTREIGRAIAGEPPTCESNADVVLDVLSGRFVSEAEQLLAAGLFLGGATVPG
jgi:pimeloyl-ACP methyl ester carboxylesterase